MDLNAFSDPRLKADIDYAGKLFAAEVVGELLAGQPDLTAGQLHEILKQRAQEARTQLEALDD